MTPRELVNTPTVKLLVYALLIGMAWADMRAQVSGKAERTEVQAMARDIQDIKAILCGRASTDSYCRAR